MKLQYIFADKKSLRTPCFHLIEFLFSYPGEPMWEGEKWRGSQFAITIVANGQNK